MTYLPPHPNPLPQGARERIRVAFTLAEVLITLGIIGVVAAMTIPTLLTAHQKKVSVTKLQKAISILNQAYRLSYDENGEATAQEAADMGNDAYFGKYWAPYLKTAHICKTYEDCGYSKYSPWLRSNKTEPANIGVVDPAGISRTTFKNPDGSVYMIMILAGGVDPADKIYIDINGSAGPNIMGHDVFVLYRRVDDVKGGTVVPYCDGYQDIQRLNRNCSTSGDCCAEKIRRAGWQIEKDYPW